MRCNRFQAVLTIAAVAVASLVLTATAAGTVITGTAGGPNGSHDTWNNAANWDAGIPSGAVNAVVGTGVTAQAWNAATPAYTGSLTLSDGSTLQLGWANPQYPEDLNALGGSGITMNDGSELRLRLAFAVAFPEIAMAGDAGIHVSPSTSAHHQTRNFDGAVTGPGGLTLIGNNNNTINLNVANSFSGGLIADADDGWQLYAKTAGSLGTGDVTINARAAGDQGASLFIDFADAIADTATLNLNGPRSNRVATKLILNADETVADFWLDGVQMAPGDYTSSSGLVDILGNPLISGSGTLTVTPAGGPSEPEPLAISINFANDQNGNAFNVTGSTGVVDVPNWNNLTSDGSGDGSMADLVDSQGNSTSASATWTSNNRWNNGSWPDDGGIGSLFRAYLDTGNGGAANGANIQIADLPAEFAGGFDVYVFFDGSGNGRFGDYTVDDGTTSITLVGNDEANNLGDFVQDLGDLASSGNYLLFEGLAGNGVTISSAATSGFRAGVNGVQIVATAAVVPEPSTFVLAVLGLLGLAWFGRRRRRRA